jgi:putative membrane protein
MDLRTRSEGILMPVLPGSSSLVADQTGPSALSAQDAAFLQQAQLSGLAEIGAGQVAIQNSSDPAVQEFGRWMATDHGALGNTLTALAQRLGVPLPTTLDPQHQSELNNLSSQTGRNFDHSYAAAQVQDHQDAVALFQREASAGQNAAVVSFAQQALPLLQAHLQQAQALRAAGQLTDLGFQLTTPPATGVTITPTQPSINPAVPNPQQDITFVQQAATSGLTEVAEGKIAASHTQNPAVSEFGRWMVADHNAVNGVLTAIAQQEGIQPPTAITPAQQAEVNSLQTLTDPQFFKTYVTDQVNDHAQTLMQFIQEANTGQDPAITAFARNEIPVLAQHLNEAVALELNLQGRPSTAADISGVVKSLIGDQPLLSGGMAMMAGSPTSANLQAMILPVG